MPVPLILINGRVKIFAFLDLEQNFSFPDGHYLINKVSNLFLFLSHPGPFSVEVIQ